MIYRSFKILDKRLQEVLISQGYTLPTEIQELGIPQILKGENVLLISPTGTGKTEAALLPIFHKILTIWGKDGLRAIYITPLKALNRDIFKRMVKIAEYLGISMTVRHGDTPISERKKLLEQATNIIVTTPETFQSFLVIEKYRKYLKDLKVVIVDEVHELAENKRGVQLSVSLERLVRIAGEYQRIALSATVGDLEKVAKLIFGIDRNYVIIVPELIRPMKITITYAPLEKVREITLKEMTNNRSAILYTNTRQLAELLGYALNVKNFHVAVHHGSLSRSLREEAEAKLKSGDIDLVVATSSLELGLDIKWVDIVFQLSSPRTVSTLIQRIGRSKHGVGEEANGLIITTSFMDILESLAIARRAIKGLIEPPLTPEKPLDVLAHQLVGFVLEYRAVKLDEFYSLVKRSWPYRNLTLEELIKVIEFLAESGKLRVYHDNGLVIKPGKLSKKYYFENLSTIPDTILFDAIDIVERRKVGVLDEEYIRLALREGSEVVILGGKPWKIINIDVDKWKVLLTPIDAPGEVPLWLGELVPVPIEVAQDASKILECLILDGKIPEGGNILDEKAIQLLLDSAEKYKKMNLPIPRPDNLILEEIRGVVVIHAHYGTKVNRALASIVRGLILKRLGISIGINLDAFRILLYPLYLGIRLNAETIKEALHNWAKEAYENGTLINIIYESPYYIEHFIDVATRFGALPRGRKRGRITIPRKYADIFKETPIGEETLREVLKDYMDFDKALEILQAVWDNNIKINIVRLENPSPLSEDMFSYGIGKLALKMAATDTIVKAVRERIINSEMRLVCLMCGWSSIFRIKSLPFKIRCSKCGSVMISAIKPRDTENFRIAKLIAKLRGKKVDPKKSENIILSAELVASYGRLAVEALAGRGIGPQTASRILLKNPNGGSEFYREIIKHEIEYARTRQFWVDRREVSPSNA